MSFLFWVLWCVSIFRQFFLTIIFFNKGMNYLWFYIFSHQSEELIVFKYFDEESLIYDFTLVILFMFLLHILILVRFLFITTRVTRNCYEKCFVYIITKRISKFLFCLAENVKTVTKHFWPTKDSIFSRKLGNRNWVFPTMISYSYGQDESL